MYAINRDLVRPDTIIHVHSQDEWTILQDVLHDMGAIHNEDKFDKSYPYRWIRKSDYGVEWTKGGKTATLSQSYNHFDKLEFEDLLISEIPDVDFSGMFDSFGGDFDDC